MFSLGFLCVIFLKWVLFSFLKLTSIKDIDIYEDIQDKDTLSTIKNFLKTNQRIKSLTYDCLRGYKKLSEEDIIELQEIVDSNPSIIGLRVYDTFIEPKGKTKVLKKVVHSALQNQYEKEEELKEVPVILMGDGTTGKNSFLRNLSGKIFQKETQSTLVLEDYQIFQVSGRKFKPITKYDLSIQRVRNMITCKYFIQDEVQKKSKYNLNFEDELITRTIREKSFVEQYTTDLSSGFRTYHTFLRVYDFGGQEVFFFSSSYFYE
eukprot:snap_masked-scaffold_24-processed-gene-4.17-mRNA-1 protein AED:1.00 eAED:1.00 QI:0/0/0/0/1/1/3/0/262